MDIRFTYSDSRAGMQSFCAKKLSEIILQIENFGWHGDIEGLVFQNNIPILQYHNRKDGLTWFSLP